MTGPLARTGAFSGTLTALPRDPHFDHRAGWAQTKVGFTFDLVEAVSDMPVRRLTPVADSPPTLSHDTTRTIMRTLTGLALGTDDSAAIDVIRHRIKVALVTGDGTSYPLGRYMFTTNTSARYTAGLRSAPALMDESFIVDQPTQTAFPAGVLPGTALNAGALAGRFAGGYPTVDLQVEATPYTTTNTWAFATSGMQVLTDIAMFGDYFNPWVGNDQAMHMIRTFDPAAQVPDLDWDAYPHVLADTVSETDDLLSAPNRFVVVGNNPAAATASGSVAIVGTYDVPANAPHSIKNRGFVVPSIQQLQLDDPHQAQAVATSLGIKDTLYQRTTLATLPDPRHDSYNVIRWRGSNWLELSWSMVLSADGGMTHTLRKTYA